jgi:hypothetical protein
MDRSRVVIKVSSMHEIVFHIIIWEINLFIRQHNVSCNLFCSCLLCVSSSWLLERHSMSHGACKPFEQEAVSYSIVLKRYSTGGRWRVTYVC